ncbi:MAG: glycoside hydrolase family 71/99-like protein [Verrucomicrobiota bacterium]
MAALLVLPGFASTNLPGPARAVDATMLHQKLLLGYQGWFACPGDGSPPNRWVHWFRSQTPAATNVTIDCWPDVSELAPEELFATDMTLPDGRPAKVYSAAQAKTVDRHFQWMQEHELDGVFLQRFTSELGDRKFFAWRNQVTAHVRAGAEAHGRIFAIMYDISGQPTNSLVRTLTNDWRFLTGSLRITESPRYLHHHGKPVVAVWGFGFAGRPDTPEQALQVIRFFKDAGCIVVGGVPAYWRTLRRDAQTNAAWAGAFRAFDVISPWSVGRYADEAGADRFCAEVTAPDLVAAKSAGCEYLPVLFPGFSWHNLNGGPLNQIPRRGGRFYWRQAVNAVNAGCTMIYGAMFDEMDEGTAMFKLAPSRSSLPAQGSFVPLDMDGENLPSDWYLRLANETGKALRGEKPAGRGLPITDFSKTSFPAAASPAVSSPDQAAPR